MDLSTSAQRTAKLSLVDLAGSERVCPGTSSGWESGPDMGGNQIRTFR